MDISGIHIIIAGIAVFLIYFIGYLRIKTIEKEGYSTKGLVIDYEPRTERVAGTWTTMDYPIVEYYDAQNNLQTGFIKYAKNTGRYFAINEEVEIIVHFNTIYYKHALSSSAYIWVSLAIVLIGIGKEIYDIWPL